MVILREMHVMCLSFLCKRNMSAKADCIWRAKRNKSPKD